MALERVKIFLWALAACGGTRMPCWDDLKKLKKIKKVLAICKKLRYNESRVEEPQKQNKT